ncbi:hypothetical protein ACFLQW_00470 [Candidatus Zixiibacteriota bacterium]
MTSVLSFADLRIGEFFTLLEVVATAISRISVFVVLPMLYRFAIDY